MEQILYKLPDGWEWKKLGDLFEIGSSKRVHQKDWTTVGVPFYRAREIVLLSKNGSVDNDLFISESMYRSFAAKYGLPESGDILVTGVGTLGICYVVKENDKFYYKDGNIICLKRKCENINSRFVEYAFQSSVLKRQVNNSAGSVVATYTISRANSTDIPFAPVEEQKRIVEKLDALLTRLDTAIDHLLKNKTLADVLLKNGLAQIFEILRINCDVVPLSSVVKINSGLALPNIFKNGFSDGALPFYKVAQMNNHHEYMVAPEITFNESVRKEHKIKLFPKGSTLIPKRGGAILTNKKRLLLEDASYDSNIMGLKADESKISDDYLFAFMRTVDLANFVDASTIPQVNNKHIDQMQIPLASIEEQADVVSRVNLLVKKVETMNSEIQNQLDDLQALRSSILDSAFKGEL